jgi:ABC-type antimicrobial peptide transport system permease subunit
VGTDLKSDRHLRSFLTLQSGTYPKRKDEILVPSLLLEQLDLKAGETILVSGKTGDESYNSTLCRISGIYLSPGMSLTGTPMIIADYDEAVSFYKPAAADLEYCLIFKDRVIPPNIDKMIFQMFPGENSIGSITSGQVSLWDVLNISVQFHVFLVVIIFLTVAVMTTVVFFVNFNIYTILFRKKEKEIGTLMAFGTSSWKIALLIFLETLFQQILSTLIALALCFAISFLAHNVYAKGFFEVLLVLLSGTNKLDFFIQIKNVVFVFTIILAAVVISQIPVILRVLISNPIVFLSKKR